MAQALMRRLPLEKRQSPRLAHRDDSWLAGLIGAFERIAQPDLHMVACDPVLVRAAASHLSRDVAVRAFRRTG